MSSTASAITSVREQQELEDDALHVATPATEGTATTCRVAAS